MWLIGVTAVSLLLNIVFSSSIAQGRSDSHVGGFPLLLSMLEMTLAGAAVLLFLAVFGCTELNSQTGLMGGLNANTVHLTAQGRNHNCRRGL